MNRQKTILLAEDDENDFMLMKLAFQKIGSEVALQRVKNGEELIRYLKREGPYNDCERYPFPNVLLTDLKMPLMTGFELLDWIRSQPDFKRLVVTILTSSSNDGDIARAYNSLANSYLVKPNTLAELVSMAEKIRGYWLELNICPPCSGEGAVGGGTGTSIAACGGAMSSVRKR